MALPPRNYVLESQLAWLGVAEKKWHLRIALGPRYAMCIMGHYIILKF